MSSSPYNTKYPQTNYELQVDSNHKDLLISQLKAHIFDIELNEKNFVKLNSKFKMLQNEFNLLSDEKLKLEYEYKTKSESTNKQLNDLRYDLENLRIAFTEKLSQNKKLFQDYSNIQIILETKTNEINDLHLQLNENVQANGKLFEEKSDLEKIVQELRENKYRNKSDYDRMQEENQKLHKKCKEEEFVIKNLEQERNRLLSLNEELKYENSNLHSKIKQRDENLIYYQKQLDDSNKTISRMSNNIKDLETQSDRLRLELENQTNINKKANRIRIEHEITYEKFSRLITEKEGEIKNLINQLDSLTIQKEKLYEDNTKMYNEIDRLKNHTYVLTQQNEKLTEELDRISEQDEKIKSHLNRREKITNILKSNKHCVENSLNNLDLDLIESSSKKTNNYNI